MDANLVCPKLNPEIFFLPFFRNTLSFPFPHETKNCNILRFALYRALLSCFHITPWSYHTAMRSRRASGASACERQPLWARPDELEDSNNKGLNNKRHLGLFSTALLL